MCGIFGCISTGSLKNYRAAIVTIMKESESRGRDAWGFYAYNPDGSAISEKDAKVTSQLYKRIGKVTEFFDEPKNKIRFNNVQCFVGHTRATTCGTEKEHKNNHPFESRSLVWAHNGGIRNHDELKRKHNLTYDSDCDSYIIGALVQKFVDEGQTVPNAIKAASKELVGGYAVWMLHKPTNTLYLFRRNNPIDCVMLQPTGAPPLFVFASNGEYIKKAFGVSEYKYLSSDKIYSVVPASASLIDRGDLEECEAERWTGPKGRQYVGIPNGTTRHGDTSQSHFSRSHTQTPIMSDNINVITKAISDFFDKRGMHVQMYIVPDPGTGAKHGATLVTTDANAISLIGRSIWANQMIPTSNDGSSILVRIKNSELPYFHRAISNVILDNTNDVFEKYVLEDVFHKLPGIVIKETDSVTLEVTVSNNKTAEILYNADVIHKYTTQLPITFTIRGSKKKKMKQKLAKIKKSIAVIKENMPYEFAG